MLSVFILSTYLVLAVRAEDSVTLTAPVQTSHGAVQGAVRTYDGTTVHVFKGIPFAAPPVGDLRFASPVAPEAWTEPLRCVEYRNRCIAMKFIDPYFYFPPREAPPMDEDCLHLTVVAPEGASDQKRAVMVYIHGGGLAAGSSADVEPEALAITADVIHIAINYRLNVFGFLASTDDSAPGNAGFYDQVMAFQWVKDNVANFGGDPDRITIFGISAGGWSVSAHVVSPLSKGLFSRAISQSGSFYGFNFETREQKQEKTKAMAAASGCDTETNAAMIKCLRETPADELFGNATANQYPSMLSPIYGDDFWPEPITDLYDKHRVHEGVEYVMGTVSEEGALVVFIAQQENFLTQVQEGIDFSDPLIDGTLGWAASTLLQLPADRSRYSEVTKLLKNVYLRTQDDKLSNVRACCDLVSDGMFIAPTLGMAEKVAEAGNKVYVYWMAQTPETKMPTKSPQLHLDAAPELEFGLNHGFDGFYMFGHLNVKDAPMGYGAHAAENDIKIARSMTHAWATFAKTGIPKYLDDEEQEVAWPEFTNDDEKYLHIKYPMSLESVKERMRPGAVDLWHKLLPAYINSLPDNPAQVDTPEGEASRENTKDEL